MGVLVENLVAEIGDHLLRLDFRAIEGRALEFSGQKAGADIGSDAAAGGGDALSQGGSGKLDLAVDLGDGKIDVKGFQMADALEAGGDVVDPFAIVVARVPLNAHFILRDKDVFPKGGDEAVAGKLADAIPAFSGAGEDFDDNSGVDHSVFRAVGVLKSAADYHDVREKIGGTLCNL